MKFKYIYLLVAIMGFYACNDEEDFITVTPEAVLPDLTAGSADFSNFVAVGASFTAGFTDNGLFKDSQEYSFPNTIAKQFEKIGGGTFNQPLMNDNFGGLAVAGNRIAQPRLVFGGAGPVALESIIGPVTVTTDLATNNPTGPFNNLGVPGAKSFHILANGYGSLANLQAGLANPYAVRMTGTTPNASILELAVAQNPTFVLFSEIGGNDVLGFATTGGDGSNPITPTQTFDFALNTMVNALTANGAKGAIGNLPNITSLSFFTTVPHNPLPIDEATAGFLNSVNAYGAYNAGLLQVEAAGLISAEEREKRTITFSASETNAVVIMDENLTDLTAINPALVSMRQATVDDLIVLPASAFIGTEAVPGNPTTVNGVAIPLEDKWVLTPEEQQAIATATEAYNASISAVAAAKGLALVDLNSILVEATASGVVFDDFTLKTNLVTGGLISLDGIHLTARGYALMANAFLEAIDATYGSNFVASGNVAKAGDFPVNYSPTLQ